MKVLDEQVRAQGRDLVAAGRSEGQALAELDGRRARWTAIARRTLDERLASQRPMATSAEG
jgi:hypothetical protein